jgi:hypothetical protein
MKAYSLTHTPWVRLQPDDQVTSASWSPEIPRDTSAQALSAGFLPAIAIASAREDTPSLVKIAET